MSNWQRNSRPKITSRKGVISTGHYLATIAGTKMFSANGNAVDAAIAAGFALAVLKPNENSLGGECPIIIYSPKTKKVITISGQGCSPQKATIEWFRNENINLIPGDGYLGATVPGLFGSYCTALRDFGRLKLKDVLGPAIELAERGYPIYGRLRDVIEENSKRFSEEWPSSAKIFLTNNLVPCIDNIIKQPALAETLKRIVRAEESSNDKGREAAIESAIDYFYKGEISDEIIRFTKSFPVKDSTGNYHGPLLEKADFYLYRSIIEEPIFLDYKNFRIYKCGTWTQGLVFLQQLKLLEGFQLEKMIHNSSEYIHLVIECSKLAFADRDKYYGDPEFCKVPQSKLLSKKYNDFQRNLINLDSANNNIINNIEFEVNKSGTYAGDTTHLDAIDEEGFMISATPSGGWIPSSPIIPNLGFPLGTRGQVFNLIKGHPNCLQPGKRPRTTLTPSLAFKDGKPWMVFGTPGADMQDQWSLQFFLNLSEFSMDLQEAIDKPAFHTCHFVSSFYPKDINKGTIFLEKGIETDEIVGLQKKGHKINILDSNMSEVCAVRRNFESDIIEGASSAKYDNQAYAMGW